MRNDRTVDRKPVVQYFFNALNLNYSLSYTTT
jgi:hypothetical protein